MADAWDQFSDAPNAGWDQFKDAPPASPPSSTWDAIRSIPGGLAQFATSFAGMPGNVGRLEERGLTWLASKINPDLGAKIGKGFDWYNRNFADYVLPTTDALDRVVMTPTGGYYKPKTLAGQYAQTIASYAPAAFGGELGPLERAATAVLPGATSETAGQFTAGTSAEPYARFAGGLFGAGLPTLARLAMRPLSQAGAEARAASRINSAAIDPATLPRKLANAPEIVPGSLPTAFQATGDAGIGSLERDIRSKYPQPFGARAADQNRARVAHLDAIQPEGSPSDLSGYLRDRLRDIDTQTNAEVEAATNLSRDRSASLGGDQSPEIYGADLRKAAQDAETVARRSERALWQAVDPQGNLTVSGAPISKAATDIESAVSPSSVPLIAPLKAAIDAAKGYGAVVPFREVGDLRSAVSEAMRQELRANGQTTNYARLARLRGSIEDAITGAAQEHVRAQGVSEADAVAAFDRVLEKQRADWYAARRVDAASVGANAAVGPGRISPTYGANRASGRGLGEAPSNPSIQGQPFDSAATERLRLATDATRNRAQTFGAPPLSTVLRRAGTQDTFRISESAVPAAVFRPGAQGGERVQAFRRAVGDDRALPAIQDYAAWSLRNSALRPDGTLDPARAGAWLNRHDSALSALPDLKARFADARSASEAIGTATAARRAALDAQQMGVLGRVTGASSPEEVTRVIGNALSSATGAQQMRALAQAASRDRGAQDGLRKAVADYLRSRFVNNGEALRSDAFQTFLRQRRDVLGQVFKPDEMRSLDAIAADLRRSHTPYPMVGTKAPKPTWLRTLVAELGGAVAGMAMSIKNPLVGWLAGKFAAKVVQAVRMAGINRSDELVREAMLNPAFARELLQTASQHNEPSALLRALARVSGSATSPVMPTPQSLPRLAPTQPQRPSMPTERFGLFGGGARP